MKGILAAFALTAAQLANAQDTTRAGIESFVRAYVEANNRADAAAMSDAMSRSTDVSSIGDGALTRGWDEIRKLAKQLERTRGMYTLEIGDMQLRLLGAEHALVIVPTATVIRADQSTIIARGRRIKGVLSLLLERTPSGWKIVHEHHSTVRTDSD